MKPAGKSGIFRLECLMLALFLAIWVPTPAKAEKMRFTVDIPREINRIYTFEDYSALLDSGKIFVDTGTRDKYKSVADMPFQIDTSRLIGITGHSLSEIYVVWGYDLDSKEWMAVKYTADTKNGRVLPSYAPQLARLAYSSSFYECIEKIVANMVSPNNYKKLYTVTVDQYVLSKSDLSAADAARSTASIDVYAYSGDIPVYSVDVAWGAMTFQYRQNVWDPETLTGGSSWCVYDSETRTALDEDQTTSEINAVTVTNRSNTGINAYFGYVPPDGCATMEGAFQYVNGDAANVKTPVYNETEKRLFLASAKSTNASLPNIASAGRVYFMPGGTPPEGLLENDTGWHEVGNITVTVT